MTDAQLWKYRAEWSKAWKALRLAGRHAGQKADDIRKRWHVLIGAVYLRGPEAGQPKSSKLLNNGEFDRFLKRCAATHSPDSLAAQMALDEQPLKRLTVATDPLFDLIEMTEDRREAYLAGIYAHVQRKRVREGARELAIAEMPDEDLQTVVAALVHTVEHKLRVEHNHPRVGKGPKARFAHAVGARAGEGAAEAATQAGARPVASAQAFAPLPMEDDGDPF